MKKILKKIILVLFILIGLFMVSVFSFRLCEDIINYDKDNQDELKVIEANYFSSYKGAIYIKMPISNNAFSFGIIIFGNKNDSVYTVRHEYGHYLQLKEYGLYKYIKYIAIPSMYGYWNDVSYYEYYSLPWEYGAELYGNVNRTDYKYNDDVMVRYNEYINMINGG